MNEIPGARRENAPLRPIAAQLRLGAGSSRWVALIGWGVLAPACAFPDIDLLDGALTSTTSSAAGSSNASTSGAETSSATSGSVASTSESASASASSAASSGGDGGDAATSSTGDGGNTDVASSSASTGGGGAGAGGGVPPLLGIAASFAVLGGSTVTNAGPTSIIGDLGVSPGTSITGIPRGMPMGTDYGSGDIADQAQLAATMARNALMVGPCDFVQPTNELGGLMLEPGVYCFGAAAVQMTGRLVLDAQGDPDARFVFRIDAALTTATFSSVTLIDGADACNVYWLVGSSATIGEGSFFLGNILAASAITLMPTASLIGRAFARTAELAMSSNTISAASCVE